MHIDTLRIFCDIVHLRSFSKTAEKHHLSQSAISQQLAQLELKHKCQLVNRRKRPLELTRAGQLFYDACKEMLGRYEQLNNDLKVLQESFVNKINVGVIYSIGMHALPVYVKKFMVQYPKVNVHIEYLNAWEIYEMILSGDLDIGLVAVPKRDRRLEVYDFQNEQLVFVCSPKHPLANEKSVDINQVQFERFIAFGSEVPTRIWIDNILRNYNIIVHPVMEFDNIETIKRAVEINSGISILPLTAIDQELFNGTLKGVSLANEEFVRPTGIIFRKNKIFGKAGHYFLDLLSGKVV